MAPVVPALELVIAAASAEANAEASGVNPSEATTPVSLLEESIVSGTDAEEIAPETSNDAIGVSVVGAEMSATVVAIPGVAAPEGGAGDAVAGSVAGSLDEIGSGAEELRKRRCSLETFPADADPVMADVQPSSVLVAVWSSGVAVEVELAVASDPVDEVSDAGATGVTG
jgi:hypothetical protein